VYSLRIVPSANNPSKASFTASRSSGVFLGYPVGVNTGDIPAGSEGSINFSFTIPFQDLVVGHQYALNVNSQPLVYYTSDSKISISQSPSTLSPIPTAGLWTRFDNTTLYTTQSSLVNYFTTNNIYQEDIANSGFFNIKIPWSLQPGDEFRFEGREDRVWMVKEAEISDYSGTPGVTIRVNKSLPATGVNYNEFLIRRYVDDASALIFEGLKPGNADGPYIIRPQYLSPELNSKIDKYITDLTNKGLL
jgi:hypothetical protein